MTRQYLYDDDGNVIAAWCGEPLDERGQEAMRALVAAALKDFGDDPDLVRRQHEAVARIRERNRRLRDVHTG